MIIVIGYRCLKCGAYDTVEFTNIDRAIEREDIGVCMKCGDDSVKEIMDVKATLKS